MFIHGGVRTDKLRTGTGLLTHTPLIDIRQHEPSNTACRIDLQRAQQAENMPRGTSAPRAPSTSGTQSGREPARPLHARTPDPRANHTCGSPFPRRHAPCSWTRRCARALSCDRRSIGSASGRRYWRAAKVCEVCEAAHLLPLHADVDLGATRAEHLWNTERARTRAPASRAHPRPATCGRITRAARAAHVGMRHVVGLQNAPAHCPATGGVAGQHRKGAIGVRQAGHCVATFSVLRRI